MNTKLLICNNGFKERAKGARNSFEMVNLYVGHAARPHRWRNCSSPVGLPERGEASMEQAILSIVLVLAVIYIVPFPVYGLGSVVASTNRVTPLIELPRSQAQ